MSKTPSRDLSRLIKSMSGTEKRYFRKRSQLHVIGKENNYMKLFFLLNKQNGSDENTEGIHEEFGKRLPRIKHYLNESILESLGDFEKDRNPMIKLNRMMISFHVLYSRGLTDQGLKVLKKAFKFAYLREEYLTCVEILERERAIRVHRAEYNRVTEIVRQQNLLLHQFRNYIAYQDLLQEVFSLLGKSRPGGKERPRFAKVQNIMKHKLLSKIEMAMSYQAQSLFHYIHYAYFLVNGEADKVVAQSAMRMKLMNENPARMDATPALTLNTLIGHVAALENFGDHEQAVIFARKVRAMKVNTAMHRARKFGGAYINEVNSNLKIGKFSACLDLLPELESEWKKVDAYQPVANAVVLNYLIAYAHFGAENWGEAVKWLNKNLDHSDSNVRRDLQNLCRIMHIFAHYELQNFELVDSLILSAYRFFYKHNDLTETNSKVLSVLRKLLRSIPGIDLNKVLAADLKTIRKLDQVAEIPGMVIKFDIPAWVQSKMLGRSFSEVFRENLAKEN